MSSSFFWFLLVCLISFIPAWLDHRATLQIAKTSSRCERRSAILKLVVMWAIPLASLVGTVISLRESQSNDRTSAEAEQRILHTELTLSNSENARLQVERTAASAILRVDTLSNQLVEARSAVRDLEARRSPRVLTEQQLTELAANLRSVPKGRVGVLVSTTHPGVYSFAQQLKLALEKSGFDVYGVETVHFLEGPKGEITLRSNAKPVPPHWLGVWDALRGLGLPCGAETGVHSVGDGAVEVLIGDRQ